MFDTIWEQGLISTETGEEVTATTTIRCDYIRVFPNYLYSISRSKYSSYMAYRFYDKNKNYLGNQKVDGMMDYSTSDGRMDKNVASMTFTILNSEVAYMRIIDDTNDLSTIYTLTTEAISPDYPSEVKSCGGNVNLFDVTKKPDVLGGKAINGLGGTDYTKIENGYRFLGRYNSIGFVFENLTKGKEYTVSFYVEVNNSPAYCQFQYGLNRQANSSADKIAVEAMGIKEGNTIRQKRKFSFVCLDDYNIVAFGIYSTTVLDGIICDITDIKLEQGSTATPYSPYGQGCIEVVNCNENFLPITANTQTVNGITFTINSDKKITVKGTSTASANIILGSVTLHKGTYTVSGSNMAYAWGTSRVEFNGATIGVLSLHSGMPSQAITLADTETITFLIIVSGTGTTVDYTTGIMIKKGETATDYVEHEEQIYIVPTQQPMRAIGDYKDTFIKKNGKWFERHYIERKVFDGVNNKFESKHASIYTDTRGFYKFALEGKIIGVNGSTSYGKSNYLKYKNSNAQSAINQDCLWWENHDIYNYASISFLTLTEANEWLVELNNSGNPFYIDYVLSTPTNLECTEEQNKILDELENAKSYKGITHIYSTDEVEPHVKSTCGSEIIPMGYFNIQKPNSEEVKEKTSFTGYDYMSKFDVTYIDDGIYPIKLYDKLNNLCKQVGMELGNTEIINGDYEITGNPFTNNETCKTVLSHIAQLACGFAKVGRNNKLYIISLSNDENTVETLDANCYMDDFSKNDIWGEVNSLIIRLSQTEGENTTIQDEESIQKNGLTEITINDNYYLTDNTEREKVIQEIWKNIKGVKYLPFSTTYYGFPYLDVGDKIKIYDTKDNEYTSYVFNHIFTYNGSFAGTLETTALTKTQTSLKNTNDIKTKFRNVELEVNKIDGKISQIIEEQDETSEKLTKHEQTIDGMKDTIKTVESGVSKAQTSADNAQASANKAQSTADTATTKANNAQADIDNLNIGGRNLLLGTKDLSGASLVKGKSNDTYNGFVYTDYEATTNDNYIDVLAWNNVLEPEPEQYYTLSFLAKGTSSITSYFYPSTVESGYSNTGRKSGGGDGRTLTPLTEEWTKYWIVWKTNKNVSGLKNIIVGRLDAKATGQVCIAAPKLEIGNKATDWTPAPEDVESDISEVTTKITEVERTAEGIRQEVSTNTTDINNNYQEIIDKLGDKAQKDDVISLENKVETVQTNTEYAIKVSEDIQANGVSKVKTETGYTFDDKGLTIEKTNAKTKSTLNETGLEVKDSTGSQEETLLKAGYDEETGETIVKSKNMNVGKYLTVGKYSRIEDYEEGTAVFWIGGNS